MNNREKMTRRNFLKWSGSTALALTALSVFDRVALADFLGSEEAANQVGILVDTTKCVGCRQCQVACQAKHNFPPLPDKVPAQVTYPEKLSATAVTHVEFFKTGGTDDAPVFTSIKRQCMHCLEPACASVCPVAAITKTPQGPVVYDADKCMGCRYCMAACPFNIPKFEWESANPRIVKCTMCADRLAEGKLPACVEACPAGALKFGARKELVAEAQARIAANPDGYLPYIYGLTQVGGTSVMYLANVPFDEIGLSMKLPDTALPDLTWQVMEKIPSIAVGVGLAMSGAALWRGRKHKAQLAAQAKEIEGEQDME